MRSIVTVFAALGLWACEGGASGEVYVCEGGWDRIVLEEGGRAVVSTPAGEREGVFDRDDDSVRITLPGRAPLVLATQGDRLNGGPEGSCKRVRPE